MVSSMIDRIRQLEEQIDYHDQRYWDDNDPEITDSDYHELVKELQNLDPENDRINQRHSSLPPSSKRSKVMHKTPLLSLDKKYAVEEILEWCTSVARGADEMFKIEPKLDGISAIFQDGVLATRGDDGVHGENITSKSPLIMVEGYDCELPLTSFKRNVRGEIVIKKSVFAENQYRLLRKNGKPYKYPRSAVVGLISQDDINVNLTNILTFAEYMKFSLLKSLTELRTLSWEFLIADFQDWDYPTDGLVIKLADQKYSNSLGNTSHHPRGQMALKYGNPTGESVLENVIWSMGKDTLTPVGQIDPIIISGAEISKVSLHNAKFIIDKDIKINDTLVIERSGDVIPHVVKVIPTEDRKDITITICPICGGALNYIEPELYCINPDCSGKLVKVLYDACKRIGIENIGEPTIEKLLDIGVENLGDILELSVEDILMLPGFAKVSATNLYNEIQKVLKSEIEDWKLLSSLNMKGIGKTICKKILQYTSLMELYEMNLDQIDQLPSIGEERAYVIHDYLHRNSEYIARLFSMLNIKTTKGTLDKSLGTVCFTGKSNITRDEWIQISEQKGFTFSNTVNKDLTYLVTDNVSKSGSKINKARKFEVKIITYDQYKEMLDQIIL